MKKILNNSFFIILKRNFPLISIFLVWSFFSLPYFAFNKVPYPSSYQVNHFKPWSHFEKYWGPVKNNAMPDIVSQIYPWRHFSVQELKNNSLPKWNPNVFTGTPHIGNFQSAVFSPLNFLYFIFSFIDAWTISVLLQPLLAGAFMYFYLRSLKVSDYARVIGSISFMFCGFIVVWMAYNTLSLAISFLPLSLLGINLGFNRSAKFFILTSIAVCFSIFSGHFQTSIYLIISTFLYSILFFYSNKNTVKFAYSIFFIISGFIISLPQILPTIQLYTLSPRSEIFINSGAIPFGYLITLFAPDFFGNPVTRNDWVGSYAERASFIGIIPFAMSLFSIYTLRSKHVRFFLLLLFFSFILSLDSFFIKIISDLKIPVISTSTPSRAIVLSSFSLSVLSAFGFDFFKKNIEKNMYKNIIRVIIALVIILFFSFAYYSFFSGLKNENVRLLQKNFILPFLLFLSFIFLVFIQYVFRFSRFKKVVLSLTVFILIFLSAFDSLRFVKKWMPEDDKGLVFPDTKIIQEIKNKIGTGRIFGNLGAQISSYYNIPELEGYDPLYIGRYGDFVRASATGEEIEAERSVVNIVRNGKYTPRLLDILGVELIFHPNADTNQSWAYPVWDMKNYSKIYEDSEFSLYKNNTVVKRASIFYKYEVINDSDKLLTRFYSDNFDFRKILLLEKLPKSIEKTGIDLDGIKNEVLFIKNSPRDIVLKVYTEVEGLLFLSDSYYPGWKASINNVEVDIFRANYAFRAVFVPKGSSTVRFFYP